MLLPPVYDDNFYLEPISCVNVKSQNSNHSLYRSRNQSNANQSKFSPLINQLANNWLDTQSTKNIYFFLILHRKLFFSFFISSHTSAHNLLLHIEMNSFFFSPPVSISLSLSVYIYLFFGKEMK
jgi:hypothetical protein